MERLPSGNAQLDLILGGGFGVNSIHVIMGSPGTGKTILAEQLAFTNGTSSRPALYITTVSEPLAKFLTYLQEYSFADTSRVGTDVIYTAVGDVLAERPEQVGELVAELVQRHRPGVVVIDSFKAISDLMPNRALWRKHLYDLAGLLSAYRTTTFWVGEYTAEMTAQLPEFAVADGIVELTREQHGTRDFRFARVVKLRGSSFLDGYHALRITPGGLDIFPRLRTPAVEPDYSPAEERLATGVSGLDAMVARGWLRGSSTLVVGPSGAGKTVLALQFLRAGVMSGEPCLFLALEENAVQLARVMRHFGWDTPSLIGPDKLDILFCSPVELQIDTIIRELFGRIEQQRVRRVVIDGVADLAGTTNDPLRLRDYLFALTQHFAEQKVTSMFTVERAELAASAVTRERIAFLADNILLLEMQLGDELKRTARILKTRGSAHDGRRRPFTIQPGGVVVG